ncbi:Flp pilus assembly complex ATPase component TadA [Candidatus Woesearchaeota archaeon]|nr:Flp pilus assembly complex ATPase component TadA [Candidatus Woesearchaeota archaeon]
MKKQEARKLVKKRISRDKKEKYDTIVPDTSIIIEGLLSEMINNGEISIKRVVIHEAVVAELESQANKGRETGYLGLEEIKNIREAAKKKGIELVFMGSRPGEFEIKHAKTGEIDARIRELARELNATLLTADTVQALVAEAKGIDVVLYEFPEEEEEFVLDQFFDENTMSVHIKEDIIPKAKKGMPGKWEFVDLDFEPLNREAMKELAKKIIEQAEKREDGFIEMDRMGSTILQVGRYRIVITRPPFSEAYEITAVRPIKILSLEDYGLNEKLLKRLDEKAEGILIAGSPGHGKTTFAQALAKHYAEKKKIVKTIEAPRDLVVPREITQYAISHGSPQEIRDILLLSRPDYTIFDEMRNTPDFQLFADLRLSGVGMIGVVHATEPIDAIQRFVRRIELGIIPHVVDTVIFIKNGSIEKVLSLSIHVKVPYGMTEADLARPVVMVEDFLTNKPEYEIYTYGEETVVVPVGVTETETPIQRLARKYLEEKLKRYSSKMKIRFLSDSKVLILIPRNSIPGIIGKQGATVSRLEKELGISISIEPLEEENLFFENFIDYTVRHSKNSIIIILPEEYANMDIGLVIDNELVGQLRASRKAEIKIRKNSQLGKSILRALNKHELRLVEL